MTVELWSFKTGLGVQAADLRGMSVQALDGSIGKVEEAVDAYGSAYLLVDTGPWIFGKTVKLPAGVVTRVDASEGSVFIDRTRDDVKSAPEHDPDAAADEKLTSYYGSASAVGGSMAHEADSTAGPLEGSSSSMFGAGSDELTPSANAEPNAVESFGSESPLGAGPDDDKVAAEDTDAYATASGETGTAPPLDALPSERPERGDEQQNADITPPLDVSPSGSSGDAFGEGAPSGELADEQTVPAEESSPELADDRPTSIQDATAAFADEQPAAAEETRAGFGGEQPTSIEEQPTQDERPTALRETSVGPADEQITSTEETSVGSADEQITSTEETSVGSADEQLSRPDKSTESGGQSSRDTGSSASKSSSKSKSGGNAASRRSSGDVPIARYDSLTAAEVIARLRNLSQRELATVERYEKRHESRQTVLSRIDSLREKEPWRGYDDATVNEVKKKLADADEERAKAVRDYERRHRERKGVMEAARRTVASG